MKPASYERLAADPSVTDPTTASESLVAQYADHYYQYDAQRRVTLHIVHSGSQAIEYAYSTSSNADGNNTWKYKTVETFSDGTQTIVYSNYAGQTMLKVAKVDSQEWCEFWKYDSSGRVALKASPSAVSGYDEQYADLLHEISGNYQYLRDNDGLIRTYTYHAPTGFPASECLQQGEMGTSIKLREYEYTACCAQGSSSSSSSSSSAVSAPCTYFLSKETVYPSDVDQTKKLETLYSYTFHADTCAVQQKTTTLPVVSTDQNGSGVAATGKEYFDLYGNVVWAMDERGFITRRKYDVVTGAQSQQIEDVDTSLISDAPSGWTTPTGGGLHLVTDFEYDNQGRTTQVLGPAHSVDVDGSVTTVRRASWMVYQDADHEVWSAQGYATGSSPSYSYTLVNPVSITKQDAAGKVLEQIQAVRNSTSGKLQASDTFPQSTYVRWTTNQYTDCCLMASQRVYHTLPSSGTGLEGTNYDERELGYDARKRQNRSVTPGGTIQWTVFDGLGRAIKSYVGTIDTGATESDPTGGGTSGNNMVLVAEMQYDGGGAGDGNLTQLKQWVDASTSRITAYSYDWRNRRTETDGEIDFLERVYFDNLDRSTKTDRYNTTSSGNLVDRSETKYDGRGRVYQTVRWSVDELTGAVGNGSINNTWYDEADNVIKSLPSGSKRFTKFAYDGLGRITRQYQGYDLDEMAYSEALSVSDDTIFEQTELTYDAANNVIQTTQRQRYHNATGTGELTTPSGSQPKARVTHVASWPDALGRQQASADFGTYQGDTFARPSTVPSRSDTILVNSLTYSSAGQVASQTNPGGVTTCLEYDAAGRRIKTVMNCVSGSSSSSSSLSSTEPGCLPSDDVNVTVLTAYNADGNVSSITAVNAMTGNQVTQYVYGSTLADSGIASSLLKVAEIYPDSEDADDRITFKYNRQGEIIETRDQNGTVHAYDYDALGRQTQDRVTTLGTNVDEAVRRISTTYTVRGAKSTIASYDNATVGSGSIVNEVLFTYNAFGQVESDYQSHSGAVNTSTTPKVQMTYADGSSNHVRQTGLIYPNGREVNYDYGAAGSAADALSRVASIINDDGTTHLADYSYLGLNNFVEVDYTEPDIKYTLVGTAGGSDPDTGDVYCGLDRFGRVKDSYWYNYGTSTDVDRIKYGYDRNGNRTYCENTIAAANGKYFDEVYGYDSIDRLKRMDRGQLTAPKDSVTSKQLAQCWSLDATGNWRKFLEDANGDGVWDLDQVRSTNQANEISDTTEHLGPAWVTPAYDRAGDMTTIPKPADPTLAFTAIYDAWNRLVRLSDASGTVAEYEYDGLKRRTVQKTYAAGVLSETRHFYYTQPGQWQVVEERLGTTLNTAAAERQFVWGLRYIDDLVLRDRDSNLDQTLDQRMYVLQDANWNVSAVTGTGGAVQERFSYSAYGESSALSPAFVGRASSWYDWEIRYAGYRWDQESLLYQVRHRYLHPGLGQWISRDPIEFAGGDENLYGYCNQRVLTYIDPLGLFTIIINLPPIWRILPTTRPMPSPQPSLPAPTPYPIGPLPPVMGPLPPPPKGPVKPQPKPMPPKPGQLPPDKPFKEPWKCPGRKGRPDSDCPPKVLDELTDNVNTSCNKPGGPAQYPGCSNINSVFWTCEQIQELADKWDKCCEARRTRELKCFRGGNINHRTKIRECEYQVESCYSLLRYWNCFREELPPGRFDPIIA